MLAGDLFRLHSDFAAHGVMVCYSGYMTQAVLEGLGNALRTKLAIDQAERAVAKNLFSVFVEQVQNVARYSAECEGAADAEPELRSGILTVGKDDAGYFVACGNLVQTAAVERIRDELKELQGLSRSELMALYKQTLKRGPPQGSKGAGVGFIDIARLAARGFEFDFVDAAGGFSFFILKANM